MSLKYKLIGKQISVFNMIDSILKNRGIENVKDFLKPNELHLESESLFDNIDFAYKYLTKHLNKNSRIVILVDCDADGYTSAATMYQYIKKIQSNANITYIVHDDKKHGLDENTMKKLEQIQYELLIIPDAGSNDYKQHQELKEKGIDVIVLDHHDSSHYSNNAIVINNQLSKNITNKAMTGVGVVYKFCKYIDKQLEVNFADEFLDLLAVGMAGDRCDLKNLESRYLTLKGIDLIAKSKNHNKFISALIKKQSKSLKDKINISGVVYYIVPLINSIIRNGTYEEKKLMFDAFINSNKTIENLPIQEYVSQTALKCKEKQENNVNEGVNAIETQIKQYQLDKQGIVVANATNIVDPNYTGLIANKISSLYQRPCLILRNENNKSIFSGSGRGYESKETEIEDFRKWCENTGLFILAEGHANAFGVAISSNNINKLYNLVNNIRVPDGLVYVDGIFDALTINDSIIKLISGFKDIWGTTVNEPLFAIENIIVNTKDIRLLGKNKNTIKMTYKGIELMLFNTNENEFNNMVRHVAIKVTMVGKFDTNNYGGRTNPQIIIRDISYVPCMNRKEF